jgi:hypothetical protein
MNNPEDRSDNPKRIPSLLEMLNNDPTVQARQAANKEANPHAIPSLREMLDNDK